MTKLLFQIILLYGSFVFLPSIISCHRIQKRIVGGQEATNMQDTVVKLVFLEPISYLPFWVYSQTTSCTGTFIASDTIITAAHCFSDLELQKHKIDITTTNDRSLRVNVHQVIIHPDYVHIDDDQDLRTYNDLAIVVLSEPLDWVQPIEIYSHTVACRTVLSLYGFGDKTEEPVSKSFFERPFFYERASLHVMKSRFTGCGDPIALITQVDRRTVCSGDSGGAVISLNGRLVGVIKGAELKKGWPSCKKGKKNISVRLSKFINFIKMHSPNTKII